MNILPLPQLKALARRGEALPDGAAIRKDFAVCDKALDAESYTAEFTITTGDVDRQGDTVAVAGWQFARFLQNPVVAWQHDYAIPPIGKTLLLTQETARIRARLQFDAEDPFARKIFAKVQAGFLNAVSVGFIPLHWEWSKDPAREYGWDISSAELLEISIVSIPANASALIDRRALPPPDAPSALPPVIPHSRLLLSRFRSVSDLRNPR